MRGGGGGGVDFIIRLGFVDEDCKFFFCNGLRLLVRIRKNLEEDEGLCCVYDGIIVEEGILR